MPGKLGDSAEATTVSKTEARGRGVSHSSTPSIKALGMAVLALLLCCGTVLVAVACGEEAVTTTVATAPPTTAAPTSAPPITAPPTTAAPAPDTTAPAAPPDGATGSPGTTVPLVAGEPIDPAALIGKWYCAANGVTQEFFADGRLTGTDSNGAVTEFSYTLDGSFMTMTMGGSGAGLQIALTLEGDTLTMDDAMQTLVFTRVK